MLKPRALTLWVASSVRVNKDTPEMASHAKVNYAKYVIVVIIDIGLTLDTVSRLGLTCISSYYLSFVVLSPA